MGLLFPREHKDFPVLYLLTPTAGNQQAQHCCATNIAIRSTGISSMFGFVDLSPDGPFLPPQTQRHSWSSEVFRLLGFAVKCQLWQPVRWTRVLAAAPALQRGDLRAQSLVLSILLDIHNHGHWAHYWPLLRMFFKIYWLFKIRFEGHLLYLLRVKVDYIVVNEETQVQREEVIFPKKHSYKFASGPQPQCSFPLSWL